VRQELVHETMCVFRNEAAIPLAS